MTHGLLALFLLFAPSVRGLLFYPVSPCRALDVPIYAGSPQPLSFNGNLCGVPSSAKIVVLNATVSAPTQDGSLTLDTFPQLHFVAGESVTNGAIVKPILPGITISAGQARLQVDAVGYYQ